jgi:hypothetical protein
MSETESLFANGRQKHLLLFKEATDLLNGVDHISTEELAALLGRRQSIIDWILEFQAGVAGIDASDPGAHAALEEFLIFQEQTVKKILEIDALVVGLAKERGSAIEAELLAIGKRKRMQNKFMSSDAKPQKHNLKGVL